MKIGTSVKDNENIISLEIVVGGQPQPLYRRYGDGKVFVVGGVGQAYSLRVRNLTGGRIEVATAVDQRNTQTDEPAITGRTRGLVIGGYCYHTFQGWRLNDRQVNRFVFAAPGGSIANQATDSTSGVGIIGFEVYREQYIPPGMYPSCGPGAGYVPGLMLETFGDPLSSPAAETAGPQLGTGMGATASEPVGTTRFTRSGGPSTLAIGYNTFEALQAMGLIHRQSRRHSCRLRLATAATSRSPRPECQAVLYRRAPGRAPLACSGLSSFIKLLLRSFCMPVDKAAAIDKVARGGYCYKTKTHSHCGLSPLTELE